MSPAAYALAIALCNVVEVAGVLGAVVVVYLWLVAR